MSNFIYLKDALRALVNNGYNKKKITNMLNNKSFKYWLGTEQGEYNDLWKDYIYDSLINPRFNRPFRDIDADEYPFNEKVVPKNKGNTRLVEFEKNSTRPWDYHRDSKYIKRFNLTGFFLQYYGEKYASATRYGVYFEDDIDAIRTLTNAFANSKMDDIKCEHIREEIQYYVFSKLMTSKLMNYKEFNVNYEILDNLENYTQNEKNVIHFAEPVASSNRVNGQYKAIDGINKDNILVLYDIYCCFINQLCKKLNITLDNFFFNNFIKHYNIEIIDNGWKTKYIYPVADYGYATYDSYWYLYNFDNFLKLRLNVYASMRELGIPCYFEKELIHGMNFIEKLFFLVNSNYRLKDIMSKSILELEEKTQLLENIQKSSVTSSSSSQLAGSGTTTNTSTGNTSNSGSSTSHLGKIITETYNTGEISTTTENENRLENIDMSLNTEDETPSTIQKTTSVNTVTQRQGDIDGNNPTLSSTTQESLAPATSTDTSSSTSSITGETVNATETSGTATSTITTIDRFNFYEYFENNNVLNILDDIKKRLYDSELFYN